MLEEQEVRIGQAQCRGKSFLVKGNICYLVRYISNLVVSIYIWIYIHIGMYLNNLFEDPEPEKRGAKETRVH